MNEIKIDLTRVISEATKEVEREAEKYTKRIVSELLSTHFRGTSEWNKKAGLGYELIKRTVDDYILSDEFSQKIITEIKKATDASASNAVKMIMDKAARKLAFKSISEE